MSEAELHNKVRLDSLVNEDAKYGCDAIGGANQLTQIDCEREGQGYFQHCPLRSTKESNCQY